MSLDAMKQALEALNKCQDWPGAYEECSRAITTLRAAIKEAQGLAEKVPAKGTLLEQTLRRVWDEMPHTAVMDAIIGGTGVMLGDKRIDPASIYKQPDQEPVAWVYPEGLEALKSGRPWTAYGSNGYSRIPLYLNDAVARRVEPPAAESGAGFESLPASPKWQGLTDAERGITAAETWGSVLIAPQSYQAFARAIEAKLKEKNS